MNKDLNDCISGMELAAVAGTIAFPVSQSRF